MTLSHSRHPWTLYYDGGCNLCHASRLQVERWAQRQGQPMRCEVLLSDEAMAKGYGDRMVLEAERVFYAADAWTRLCAIGPWWVRWIWWLSHVPGLHWIIGAVYEVVQRYRLRWFGTRECKVP